MRDSVCGFVWFSVCFVGGLVGGFVGSLVRWSVGSLVRSFVGSLVRWLFGWMVGLLVVVRLFKAKSKVAHKQRSHPESNPEASTRCGKPFEFGFVTAILM